MKTDAPIRSLSITVGDAVQELHLSPCPDGVDLCLSEADAIRMRDWLNVLYPPSPVSSNVPVAWMLHRQEDGKPRVLDVYKTKRIAEGWKEKVGRSRITLLARRPGCGEWVVSGLCFVQAPDSVPANMMGLPVAPE